VVPQVVSGQAILLQGEAEPSMKHACLDRECIPSFTCSLPAGHTITTSRCSDTLQCTADTVRRPCHDIFCRMRGTGHLTRGLQHVLRTVCTEPRFMLRTPELSASVCMPAAGFRCFRGVSNDSGGHHRQFSQPKWRPAQILATAPMPRQKKTRARAFAGQPVRLPKPALLEFAQQLERCARPEWPGDQSLI
jgi:hypothetical protein